MTDFTEVRSTGFSPLTTAVTIQSQRIRTVYGFETAVTMAHIHIAQPGVSGGIMVWLCGSASNPGPTGTPACPEAPGGSISGELTPAQVVGPAGQGIAPGEFDEFARAVLNGVAYANVHSMQYGGGEIRGQLSPMWHRR